VTGSFLGRSLIKEMFGLRASEMQLIAGIRRAGSGPGGKFFALPRQDLKA